MVIELEGFHGTSFDGASSIIKEGYKSSTGDSEWLGDGVYFFLEGLSKSPQMQAEEWTIAQAWDKQHQTFKYKKLSVLKSIIKVEEDHFLDLTSSDGIEIFDYIVSKHTEKMSSINKRMTYIDGFVINFARKEGLLPVEVTKGNFYIKFTDERIKRISRRTPNCTVCSVYDPAKNIKNTELLLTKDF